MTEDEAYELLATHKMLECKVRPGEFYCGAIGCPHQYSAPPSRNWQAHRRHWAKLFADATAPKRPVENCPTWQDGLCICTVDGGCGN